MIINDNVLSSLEQEQQKPDLPLVGIPDIGLLNLMNVLNGSETALTGQICKYDNHTILNAFVANVKIIYQYLTKEMLPERYRVESPEEREEAGQILDFAREVMHKVYNYGGVTLADLKRLTEFKKCHVLEFLPTHTPNEQDIVICGHIFKVATGGIFAMLSADLVGILDRLIKYDSSLLMQCPVCRTLFVRDKDKPTQIYDSSACSNRARQRNWYQKKANHNVDNR